MTRLDLIGLVVRPLRRLLSGRRYTQRFPRAYALYTRLLGRVMPRSLSLLTIDGHRMYVDPRDRGVDLDLILTGDYEGSEKRLLLGMVGPGARVLEVGANIGDYTLALARACGETGRVYAFEPSPRIFAILEKNVRLNDLRNVVLVNKALTDRAGPVLLFEHADTSARSSLIPGLVRGRCEGTSVGATTLDGFVVEKAVDRLDLVKADVEGAEYLVLSGGQDALRRFRPVVCIEFWPRGLELAGAGPMELLAFLRSLAYEVAIVQADEGRTARLRPATDAEILEECRSRGLETGKCDLLLRPAATGARR